jgi:hypothetical protein
VDGTIVEKRDERKEKRGKREGQCCVLGGEGFALRRGVISPLAPGD